MTDELERARLASDRQSAAGVGARLDDERRRASLLGRLKKLLEAEPE